MLCLITLSLRGDFQRFLFRGRFGFEEILEVILTLEVQSSSINYYSNISSFPFFLHFQTILYIPKSPHSSESSVKVIFISSDPICPASTLRCYSRIIFQCKPCLARRRSSVIIHGRREIFNLQLRFHQGKKLKKKGKEERGEREKRRREVRRTTDEEISWTNVHWS